MEKSMTLKNASVPIIAGVDSRELFKGCKIEADQSFDDYLNSV